MICAVLYAESFSLLDQQLQAALNQGSEIIEIRLDAISNLNIEHLSNLIKKYHDTDIILTLRSEWKSTEIDPPIEGRQSLLKKIIKLKPKFLDLEFPLDMHLISSLPSETTPVITALDFEGMAKIALDPLLDLVLKINRKLIVKIAATPNTVNDLQQIWRWSKILKKNKLDYVVLGMGQLGQITRVKYKELGNVWTYGRFDKKEGEPFLPGMLFIEELMKSNPISSYHLANIGDISENDALRTIYSELFKVSKIDGIFMNLPIQTSPELDQMMLWFEDGLLDGINITKPWQVDILDKISIKDPSADIMGAANCITYTKDGLKAYNTQIEGLKRSLEPFSLKRIKRVYIDGTERIAKAVVEVLKDKVETIVIRDELFSSGNDLVDHYDSLMSSLDSYSDNYDLIVNCNKPVKGFENVVMLPRSILENAKLIFDPMSKLNIKSPLKKFAEKNSIRYIGGYQFFFNTALANFELWTKRSIPNSSINSDLFDPFDDEIDFGFMLNY